MSSQKSLVFVHIPKTAGSFMTNLLEKTGIGYSLGFDTLGERYGDIDGGQITYVTVRNPYSWYQSLYQYWCDQLVQGSDVFNPIIRVARLPYNEFIQTLTDPVKFGCFMDHSGISETVIRSLKMPIGLTDLRKSLYRFYNYRYCSKVMGFFSYLVLEYIFDGELVRDLSIDSIIANRDGLLLTHNILRQENLVADLTQLLDANDIVLPIQVNQCKKVNVSRPQKLTLDETTRALIKDRDRLVFVLGKYDD